MLHASIICLTQKNLSEPDLEFAETTLSEFMKSSLRLYGVKIATYNFHDCRTFLPCRFSPVTIFPPLFNFPLDNFPPLFNFPLDNFPPLFISYFSNYIFEFPKKFEKK